MSLTYRWRCKLLTHSLWRIKPTSHHSFTSCWCSHSAHLWVTSCNWRCQNCYVNVHKIYFHFVCSVLVESLHGTDAHFYVSPKNQSICRLKGFTLNWNRIISYRHLTVTNLYALHIDICGILAKLLVVLYRICLLMSCVCVCTFSIVEKLFFSCFTISSFIFGFLFFVIYHRPILTSV